MAAMVTPRNKSRDSSLPVFEDTFFLCCVADGLTKVVIWFAPFFADGHTSFRSLKVYSWQGERLKPRSQPVALGTCSRFEGGNETALAGDSRVRNGQCRVTLVT